MANTDKNIVITPNIGQTADPKVVYSGANATVGAQNITLNVYPDNSGTLSWEGSAGQLLSVTNTLTGTIFAVNDVSGIPSITVQDTGQVTLAPYTGNLVIGNVTDANTAKVQVTGNVALSGIINANANGVGNIGSATGYFNTVFAKATSAQYADLAEKYVADAEYPPGTVLIFGGAQEVTASSVSHDPRTAGVVSTDPSYLMNSGLVGPNTVAVALTGRVPCWVQGPVAKGDRLVNRDTGVAGRLDPDKYEPGCIIGKSLETIKDDSLHLIEIAIGRY